MSPPFFYTNLIPVYSPLYRPTETNVLNEIETKHLLDEVEQLVRLFSSIKRKMKD